MITINNKFLIKPSLIILLIAILSGCNSIDRRPAFPVKQKLDPVVNSFQVKKVFSKKIAYLKKDDLINSAILLNANQNQNQFFTGDLSGDVVAVNAKGDVLWKKNVSKAITAGPTFLSNKLFVTTVEAKIFCLDAKNGKIIWQSKLSSDALAAPAATNDAVFVHTLDGGLSALNLEDGRQLWRVSTALPNITLRRGSTPVITGNHVIVGFANGKLFAVNKETGTVNWAYNISNPQGRSDLQRITDISAEPIIVNGIVYAVSYQGNLVAIRLRDGEILWEKESSSYTGITIDQNAVYISKVDGSVVAMDRKTGNIFWTQDELRGRHLTKPVIYNSYVVVGDEDGNLHFLDKIYGVAKGRELVDTSGISVKPLIINNNQLYILSNNGYLHAVEIS
jgi:outer membrane protein assembly factor BamB